MNGGLHSSRESWLKQNRRRHAIADERFRRMASGLATPEEMAGWFGVRKKAATNEGATTMEATQPTGSGSGSVGGNGSPVVIDDRIPMPEGKYMAAVRLIALLGSGDHFTTNGKPDGLARSAWQWVVRLDDGTLATLATLTHLVTLDPDEGSHARTLGAALVGDESLAWARNWHCDARRLVGRSATVEVRRRPCGNGRDRPYVATAWALPDGAEPVGLTDALVWTPDGKKQLPSWVPQWVRNYANLAVTKTWQGRRDETK